MRWTSLGFLAVLAACSTPPADGTRPPVWAESGAPPAGAEPPLSAQSPRPVALPHAFTLAPGATLRLPAQPLRVATLTLGPAAASPAASPAARRLMHHAPRPQPRGPHRALLQTRSLGDTEDFWVNRGAFDEATDARRTCRRIATRGGVHLYADLEARVNLERLRGLLTTFVDETRPTLEAVYGAIPDPIALVVSPAVDDFGARTGALAYFWARDLMPAEPRSNQIAALFFSDDLLPRPAVVRRAVMAHETTHLLAFNTKTKAAGQVVDEPAWLDEALAVAGPDLVGAGTAAGYPHTAEDLADFAAAPGAEPLTAWFTGKPGASFGRAWTLTRYARDRYGDRILHDLVATPRLGTEAWAEALKPHGTDFRNFAAAWLGAIARQEVPQVPALTWAGSAPDPRPWGMSFIQADGPWDLTPPPGAELAGVALPRP